MLAALTALLTVQSAQTGPIEVPFRLGENAIIVDAKVNGKTVSLMFDTGFSGSVVMQSTLNIGPVTGTTKLRDFVGEFEASLVKIRSLSLGAEVIDVKTMSDVVVTPPEDSSFVYGTHVDGIMGFEVIRDNVVEINFEKQKFIFYPRSTDISKRVPDNKTTFLTKLLPIGATSMEMSVEVSTGKKLTLALDTGNAFYATTHKDSLERVGLWEVGKPVKYMSSSGVASGSVDSWSYKMGPVKIFGIPVQSSVWDIIDLPSSSAEGDGTVGYGFLKNFNITLDYERRRVWFKNFTGKVSDEEVGTTGIAAGWDDRRKRTLIFRVSPESPAAVAGIKEGDQILSLNNQELNQAGFRKMRKLLEGPVGSKVELAISRNGALQRYAVERKLLLNQFPD
jgi:predicted aspartyl protease